MKTYERLLKKISEQCPELYSSLKKDIVLIRCRGINDGTHFAWQSTTITPNVYSYETMTNLLKKDVKLKAIYCHGVGAKQQGWEILVNN